jgi:outer membrane protein TolC
MFVFFALQSYAVQGMAAPVLSLEDCLAIAQANHPSIAGAEASIVSGRGQLARTVASDRLTATGDVSTSRTGAEHGEASSFSMGATVSVKIFDANRNKYAVDSARYSLSATDEDARRTATEVRSNVKSSYMTLLLNHETARQRLESVRAFERHLEQAKGLYESGSKPWYDVTKAEVDLGNAQLAFVEAEGGIETAKAALLNAMGIDQSEEFDIAPVDLDAASAPEWTGDEAMRQALENRPDYKSSALKIMAGQANLSSEARASSPTLSLTGGYSGSGNDISDLERGWNVGLRMSAPIADGGAEKARVESARGQVMSLEASHEKLRQDIMLEVRKAQSDITKARERIRISEITLTSAEENRKMAVGRYETGIGDPLEVTDALLSYADAMLSNRQAKYDLQLAIIGLERAMGTER